MAKRKRKVLKFYQWEIIFRIEVASDGCQKIYRNLEDALFCEFNTNAVLKKTYANEDCVHFSITVGPGDQEKLINLISKFCRKQRLILFKDAKK